MPSTAVGAVLRATDQPLRVEEIELRDPGPSEVRVRMTAAGVCHSDLSLARGVLPHHLPAVLGHEGVGDVVEVGEGVTGLRVGDQVVLNWSPPCRDCWFCRGGQPYLCQASLRYATRPHAVGADGGPLFPGLGAAAFATETLVAEDACVPLPPGTPAVEAALLGCAALTGVGAVRNAARVRPGESVVVLGLGGVGLCAVQAGRIAGADPVIAVDPAPEKAALAESLGATEVLEPGPELARRVRRLTGGRGADHAVECVGRATSIRAAWDVLRRGGRATVVGLGERSDTLSLSAAEVAMQGRTLAGCMYGDCDPAEDLPVLLGLLGAGTLDLRSLVDRRIALSEVEDVFADLDRGRGARAVVVFDQGDQG
ncbi:zinc-binding dehydrogenase [Actinoalloteichus spitiensis]|uniref:zinc-binding dehydrogenase n=1 Tax=Actinoalloteichus spitiensis TaxID=252394 RepID=UPI000375F64F|nr:zinc-binding dehydrogenase [Actinoalloteichus spitiensis]